MLQAKIVEDNLIFLNSQLGQCSENQYKTLVFEDFLQNPTKYTEALSNWWGIALPELEKGIEALRTPTQVHEIPHEIKNALEVFFSPKRRQQWPIFTTKRNCLISDSV
jgi:hypothetical protein